MHFGAKSSVAVSMEDPVRDAFVNAMGSLNVLECARRSGARKVVYAASGGTLYGDPRKLPVKETALGGGRPVSPYGISKKVVLDYLSFYERYHGIEWAALALANVYGPRQDPDGEAGGHRHLRVGQCWGCATPTIFGDGEPDARLRLRGRRRPRLRPGGRPRERASGEHRDGRRDLGERPVPDARGAHGVRRRARPRRRASRGRPAPERPGDLARRGGPRMAAVDAPGGRARERPSPT